MARKWCEEVCRRVRAMPRPENEFPKTNRCNLYYRVPESFCSCKTAVILYIGKMQRLAGAADVDTPSLILIRTALVRSSLQKMLWEFTGRMQPDFQDRRTTRRFDMRLPAVVRLVQENDSRNVQESQQENEFHTETQNVSARGVFFYLDRPVPAGTPCEVILTFPPHITLTDAVRVRFSARVIRVESPLPSSRIGTVAMIEDYEFLRSGGASDFLSALQRDWKKTN